MANMQSSGGMAMPMPTPWLVESLAKQLAISIVKEAELYTSGGGHLTDSEDSKSSLKMLVS